MSTFQVTQHISFKRACKVISLVTYSNTLTNKLTRDSLWVKCHSAAFVFCHHHGSKVSAGGGWIYQQQRYLEQLPLDPPHHCHM